MSDWRCHHCGHDFGERGEPDTRRQCPVCASSAPADMTADQLKDAERNRRYIEREGLVSLMNATKWREAEMAISRLAGRWPWWRVATVREGPMDQFDNDEFYFKAIPRELIETLDIDVARTVGETGGPAAVEVVANALIKLGVPFTRENGFLRVWGYARPGAFPSFPDFSGDHDTR